MVRVLEWLFPDLDAADGIQLFRVALWFGAPCYILLSIAGFLLAAQGAIPGWLFPLMLFVNAPLTWVGVLLIYHTTSRTAEALVKGLLAAGNIPPPRSYPNQDLLIVRGEYREAADYFRDHLRIEPDDQDARLRLADLLEHHLNDVDGAEALYLEVRRGNPDPRQALVATNGLIDLYRKTGRRDRLMVELARFADHYRGSRPAKGAARELQELKAELGGAVPTSGSRRSPR
jgi:tetratricopeptide (TPR) repeat protein